MVQIVQVAVALQEYAKLCQVAQHVLTTSSACQFKLREHPFNIATGELSENNQMENKAMDFEFISLTLSPLPDSSCIFP
eukprot:13906135-Ditylum_brightwellii.AAC.2